MGFLLIISMLPLQYKRALHTMGPLYFGAHFIAFVITALLFCWKPQGFSRKCPWAAGACATALFLEVLEAVCYHNPVEWLDVWTGCLGVAAGLIVLVMLQRTPTSAPSYQNKG